MPKCYYDMPCRVYESRPRERDGYELYGFDAAGAFRGRWQG